MHEVVLPGVDTGAPLKFPLVLAGVKSHNSQPMNHNPDDLIMLFNDLFRESCRTLLVRGSNEPEYIPASEPEGFARVVFAHGYFASALHEIAQSTAAHCTTMVTGIVRTGVPRSS